MNEQEKTRAIEITKEIKTVMRTILDKYASEVSAINQNNDDPHSPIIGCLQMTMAQASTEYMITCGATPNEAVQATVNNMNLAMQHWVASILRPVPKK